MKERRRGRKLLVATAGLATVMYVACKSQPSQPPGNLVAPPPTEVPPGNLPAPPPIQEDAGVPDKPDAASDADADATATIAVPPPPSDPKLPVPRPVGNLVAPPPLEPPPKPEK